ncbi:adenylate kinase [Methanomicrobium sp. W14]|uniref:adenylate kinase family protein n=1 Tax=Methanomicrobium sp. W14 TaxID=2817839 RepID=UPI001AE12C50|nr:adenylate kinase family protein [Methanomicrobium sp. W14]MBP2134566.1 adenylate kinase [Methanomicrobium sp. W14]
MTVCITGTPGTGKSSVSKVLKKRGYNVVSQNDTAKKYIIGADPDRNTEIIDEDKWVEEFKPFDGIIEGHITHLLPCRRLVVLRCRPDVLKKRLLKRGYSEEKASENAMAEALDVVLVESLEVHPGDIIFESDTTFADVEKTADEIEMFIEGKTSFRYGSTDWSEYLGERI